MAAMLPMTEGTVTMMNRHKNDRLVVAWKRAKPLKPSSVCREIVDSVVENMWIKTGG